MGAAVTQQSVGVFIFFIYFIISIVLLVNIILLLFHAYIYISLLFKLRRGIQ